MSQNLDDVEIGLPFNDANLWLSQAKLNAKSWLIADADFLAAYGQLFRGMPMRCVGSVTNGIFQPDRSYFVSSDGTQILPDTGILHRHNDETDEAGGRFRNILLSNMNDYYQTELLNPTANHFLQRVLGGSTVQTTAYGVECVTDNITNNYAMARLPGGCLDLRQPCAFDAFAWVNSGVMCTTKIGIGMEDVQAGEPLYQRFGLEQCDVANSARTWNIVTGDGISWTMEPTSENVARTSGQGFKMDLTPLERVRYTRVDLNGFDTISEKGTNVPGSTDLTPGWVFGFGIRTNTTEEKRFILNMLRIIGKTSDYGFAPGPHVSEG
jgi:hypothetical protein